MSLSVRDLCGPEWCGGSLNLLPLSGARNELGQAVHQEHQVRQQALYASYQKEQSIRFETRHREYAVSIQGRIDGVYVKDDKTILEEIKSVLSGQEDFRPQDLPDRYFLQLKLYLYFWSQLDVGAKVLGHLVVINADGQDLATWEVPLNAAEMQNFISDQLEKMILAAEAAEQRRAAITSQDANLAFPYPHMRPYQDSMIEAIETALQNQENLLVSAPTGIGKTVAALYGTLPFAAKNGFSIFFLTSKTTQQRIVVDTLQRLSLSGESSSRPGSNPAIPWSSLVLRSKEKSCANDVVCCHESRCPYAKNFFGKLEHSALRSVFMNVPVVTPDLVYKAAVDAEICPFELSLELVSQSQVTVCDYNYIYDPRISLEGLSGLEPGRTILIIDEAHNLYSRARDYYSPELDLQTLLSLKQQLLSMLEEPPASRQRELQEQGSPSPPSSGFLGDLIAFLEKIEHYVRELGELFPEIQASPQAEISLDREFFREQKETLDALMQRYLVEQRRRGNWRDEDRILDFFYALSRFCIVLELSGGEFVHVLDAAGEIPKIKIVCLDPSRQLKKTNDLYYAVIAMSATLTPLKFYSDVLGFERSARTLALPSPFPPENRKILVIPEVSTTYRQRHQHIGRIAQIIEEIIGVHRGNYFAFFPSFEFLELVARHLQPRHYQILIQNRVMADHHRNALLGKLSARDTAHLVLAVQGGIFAEGVDYPGELAIGAIIVGPGLPKVSFETELVRRHYEESCSKGFEYAFLYPGMNRVVQSAGRIIRSETDRGIFVLLDRRFSYDNYMSLFPRDWYESSPQELISRDFVQELRDFWNSPG
ncbi:MAG: ATP-dependent DNA helicase [Terriglobia bacterium]